MYHAALGLAMGNWYQRPERNSFEEADDHEERQHLAGRRAGGQIAMPIGMEAALQRKTSASTTYLTISVLVALHRFGDPRLLVRASNSRSIMT